MKKKEKSFCVENTFWLLYIFGNKNPKIIIFESFLFLLDSCHSGPYQVAQGGPVDVKVLRSDAFPCSPVTEEPKQAQERDGKEESQSLLEPLSVFQLF